jgi:hypothetical protein
VAAQDRAVTRDTVAQGDRPVEAPLRPGEDECGIVDGAPERPFERGSEGKRAKAGLAVEGHDRAHARSLAEGPVELLDGNDGLDRGYRR